MTQGIADGPVVSVVIPARAAEATLGECLHALANQSLSSNAYEVIVVVDDPAGDASIQIAQAAGVRVIHSGGSGAAAARNAGVDVARGHWIAFTDADCVPSRAWLSQLLRAVQSPLPEQVLGAAGATVGYGSTSAAARYVDVTGGLHAERHLAHERYPWAPTGNVMYRRDALRQVAGFDARFHTYEGCDLHTRLLRQVGGKFEFVPGAVVLHHHRSSWRAYWAQQVGYGVGYGQFFRRYETELKWTARDELRAWVGVLAGLGRAVVVHGEDRGLIARGDAIKGLAQRVGFLRAYWNPRETRRWRQDGAPAARPAS